MNLLVVDIGNTDVKFGIFQDGELIRHWRESGSHQFAEQPDAFCLLMKSILSDAMPDALAYVSVVPALDPLLPQVAHGLLQWTDRQIFAIHRGIHLPLDMSRYPLEQLGMDRLVNACAVSLLFPQKNVVVVDFGTATTFDLVNAQGVYLGGAIAPGLQTLSESLSIKTAKLPSISLVDKASAGLRMGVDTLSSMEAGCGFGYRGLMKELLTASAQALEAADCLYIATGGLAESVIRLCGLEAVFHQVDPVLTLKGLRQLCEFNRTAGPSASGLRP